MEPVLRNYPLTTGTQHQPEEQAELYQRPSASSSSVPLVASSYLDPSVSRPMVARPLSVHHHAPGYSDPHVSPCATVPAQSLLYPVPVASSYLDPSVSRPMVARALSVHHHAPGYSDPHVSPYATVPAQSPLYPVPVASSYLDPSVSRPMVARALSVHHHAQGYSDPHVSPYATVPAQSLLYPVPVASSYLDPSVSWPMVARALSVHHHAQGYSDPHVSPHATVPAQSLLYPVPVSQSGGVFSLLPLPGSAAPISTSPSYAGQNNPSTDAESETTEADSRQVSVPANTGGSNGQDITDHDTTSNTRTSIPVDSALRLELMTEGSFLDPEKYEPVKRLGRGGFAKVIYHLLTPASHMEVGCPGTWGLELLTPNPGSKSTPQACPTRNSTTSPAHHTLPQPKHPSHRARSSVEIIITVITNKSNNNKDNNNNAVIIIKRERRVGENTKTLQKLIKTPQTLSTVKLRPHVTAHAYITTTTR